MLKRIETIQGFVAYPVVESGERLDMPFVGKTAEEAEAKLRAFWEAPKAIKPAQEPPKPRKAIEVPKLVEKPPTASHGLSGSMWLGNRKTKEKRRVAPAEAKTLLASGWVKVGPRTKL